MSILPESAKDGVFATSLQSGIIEHIECLRQLKYLAIVDVNLSENRNVPKVVLEKARRTCKGGLVSILKDSPSEDHKVLRWKIVQLAPPGCVVVEDEELEVLPETSL